MKRNLLAVVAISAVVLSSCLIVISGPELEISVDYAGSSSYDGYYEIDLSVENVGYGKAYVSDYYALMTGSTGSPISFDIYGPDIVDLEPGEVQYVTLYGYSDLYVPYDYEIFIEYYGSEGVFRTEEASGSFTIGDPGTPYITYTWTSSPFTYSTDDPGIPDLIYNGQYYETQPGTYSFWYQTWDGSTWAGNYTIYRDTGDAGVDGKDFYFELECLRTGPAFVIRTYPASLGSSSVDDPGPTAAEVETDHTSRDGSVTVTEGKIGSFRYSLEYWNVK